MKIHISELFKYRQFVDQPLYFCFDKKEYKICDASLLDTQKCEPYRRYIPLLQIDESNIQQAYIASLNDKKLLRDFNSTDLCFNAFVDYCGFQNDWWNYYRRIVFELEKIWCEENSIQYIVDL